MAVDAQLLAQALHTPATQDVTRSPIVRAVIVNDPANAGDLVPVLERSDTLEAGNARRILCLFDARAVPHILAALAPAPATARKQGIEVIWALLTGEPVRTITQTLGTAAADLDVLLRDRSPLPDDMPQHIERDFRGRICDLTYLVITQLLDTKSDPSAFRGLEDPGRDEAIRRLQSRGFGQNIS